MTWFEDLVGFPENGGDAVRNDLVLDGEHIVSKANGRRIRHGRLEIVSAGELARRAAQFTSTGRRLDLREHIGEAGFIHALENSSGALFQAASQFNLLEMASPRLTPEDGIGIYEQDQTQGPACAIACGAGTIFRNYLVPVNGRIGQTAEDQIDCLALIGRRLRNDANRFWSLQNGYAFADESGLRRLNAELEAMSAPAMRALEDSLYVGIHWDTEVTVHSAGHCVTQVFCSALPVGYSHVGSETWAPFSRLILRATYRATLCAAAINAAATENRRVFLTLVGGGVFGNSPDWIRDAVLGACDDYSGFDLDCRIVSYQQPNPMVSSIVTAYEWFDAASHPR
jgi:hypothetical protein